MSKIHGDCVGQQGVVAGQGPQSTSGCTIANDVDDVYFDDEAARSIRLTKCEDLPYSQARQASASMRGAWCSTAHSVILIVSAAPGTSELQTVSARRQPHRCDEQRRRSQTECDPGPAASAPSTDAL